MDFHDYKLTIEIEENGSSSRNIDYEKRQKAKEQELGCKFVRIDPDKEELSMKYLDTLNNQLKNSHK